MSFYSKFFFCKLASRDAGNIFGSWKMQQILSISREMKKSGICKPFDILNKCHCVNPSRNMKNIFVSRDITNPTTYTISFLKLMYFEYTLLFFFYVKTSVTIPLGVPSPWVTSKVYFYVSEWPIVETIDCNETWLCIQCKVYIY